MKLYYSPGACSLAAHIALEEAALRYEAVRVNLKDKTLPDQSDYRVICPQGYVPALQLKNGELLTENAAVLQYIADQAPATGLAPANGSLARYRLQAWLNFIATELHKNFSPLFDNSAEDVTKQRSRKMLANRLTQLDQQLSGQTYLQGDYFTIADGYLFVVLSWAAYVQVDLTPYPALQQFSSLCAQRPAVQRALTLEGLIKT